MGSFKMLKRETGYNSQTLGQLTGYSRQGLYYAFKMLDKGMPSKRFLDCIGQAIQARIEQEEDALKCDTEFHIKKIEQLKKVKSNIERYKNDCCQQLEHGR